MNAQLTEVARSVGLEFSMDKVIPANSFRAHRLIHLARTKRKQTEMKESLLKAKFVEGRDIDSLEALRSSAQDVGIPDDEFHEAFEGDAFAREVRSDEREAAQFGIRGVPFFVINREIALSGAQPPETILKVLRDVKKSKG